VFPTKQQYRKWSLPTKWSFWAAVIGIPLGVASFFLSLYPMLWIDKKAADRSNLFIRAAQELRYNNEWFQALSKGRNVSKHQPLIGAIRVDGLMELMKNEHDLIVKHAYGEEKYIYQHALMLQDVATLMGKARTGADIERLFEKSPYSVDDAHFLNNFLFWYLAPTIRDSVKEPQLYSLGVAWYPGERLVNANMRPAKMKYFLQERRAISEYREYLGLID
jgi:hypothetical protein